MCVSGVHHLAKNAYTKTQPKGSGLAKSSSETDSSVGEINQRTAKMMPCGTGKVQSDSKVWIGVKLIAAMTCQQIFGWNKRVMTLLFMGIFVTAFKTTGSLNAQKKLNCVKLLVDISKFFELSFYKKDLKDAINLAFSKYSKGFKV
jgi:hypothetical protein